MRRWAPEVLSVCCPLPWPRHLKATVPCALTAIIVASTMLLCVSLGAEVQGFRWVGIVEQLPSAMTTDVTHQTQKSLQRPLRTQHAISQTQLTDHRDASLQLWKASSWHASWTSLSLAALGISGVMAATILRSMRRRVPHQPITWTALGYYGRGFQKAGQMTDEQAWLAANELILVKDKPAKDRWAPSEMEGEAPDVDDVEHPDVGRAYRYPSTPGSGTWGVPLSGYRVRQKEEDDTWEYWDPTHPIFLDEALAYLDVKDGGRYLDACFGSGAYSSAMLATADCNVVALDADPSVMEVAVDVRHKYGSRFDFRPVSFASAAEALAPRPLQPHEQFDGVILDLRTLSEQMDLEQRGLLVNDDIFIQDAVLEDSVADFLNNAYPELIAYVIYWYGREVQGRALARAIVRERRRNPIRTKFTLAKVVRNVGERHYLLFDGIDPAKRVLLAIRVYMMVDKVNRFLAGLKPLLATDGRIIISSHHPWLDGVVKNFLDKYTLAIAMPKPVPSARKPLPVDPPSYILLKPIEWLRVLTRIPLSKGKSSTHPGWPEARLRVAEKVDPEQEEERRAPKWDF